MTLKRANESHMSTSKMLSCACLWKHEFACRRRHDNTPPKRLSTRAMKLDKISLMCSSLDRIQTTKIHRIESQVKLSRTKQVRNNVHSTSFAQNTFTQNQLTQGSIWIPLRYHVVITFQKNPSGSNSVSQFSGYHNTTCYPQRGHPRSNRLDLLPSLANNLLQPCRFHRQRLDFPALCAMLRAATESQ